MSRLCLPRVRNMTCEFSFICEKKLTFCACSTSWWVIPLSQVCLLTQSQQLLSFHWFGTCLFLSGSSSNPLYQLHPWASDFSVWPVTCQSLHFYIWKNENKNNMSLIIHTIKWKKTTNERLLAMTIFSRKEVMVK